MVDLNKVLTWWARNHFVILILKKKIRSLFRHNHFKETRSDILFFIQIRILQKSIKWNTVEEISALLFFPIFKVKQSVRSGKNKIKIKPEKFIILKLLCSENCLMWDRSRHILFPNFPVCRIWQIKVDSIFSAWALQISQVS